MKKTIFKLLKIGDFILIGLILIGFLIGVFWIRRDISKGEEVSIFIDNREVYRFSLFESKTFSIQGMIGETLIQINQGQIWVEKAPCPHQICKNMGKISHSGETIVCIPNRILIQINGRSHNQVDSITM